MKIYLRENVFDAALNRIRWLFDEFETVIVGVSGGKDSTVVFELAYKVAKEKMRLPLKVMFIDQEAEWQSTIEQVRQIKARRGVEMLWYQIPLNMPNATSTTAETLRAWDEKHPDDWMRPKEPDAITENIYGTDRFFLTFENILRVDYKDRKVCYIAGVRCEESPARYIAMLGHTYKGETWGKRFSKVREHYTFYPIYDWSYTDVWKAIHDNKWSYNTLYDRHYQYGIPIREMRVSNVHHETAVRSLFHLQEIEPKTYEALCKRVSGIDMAGKMGTDDYFIKELPYMFKDWREYRDYLMEKLVINPEWKAQFAKKFAWQEKFWLYTHGDKLFKLHVNSILTNDHECVKLDNWERNPDHAMIRQIKQGKRQGTIHKGRRA